jgi:hypothetical protein
MHLPNVGTPSKAKVEKKPLALKGFVGHNVTFEVYERPRTSNGRLSGCELTRERERMQCSV